MSLLPLLDPSLIYDVISRKEEVSEPRDSVKNAEHIPLRALLEGDTCSRLLCVPSEMHLVRKKVKKWNK